MQLKRKYSTEGMEHRSWYSTYKKNKELLRRDGDSCFSYYGYNNHDVLGKEDLMEVRVPVEHCSYSIKEIERWILDLNEMGFVCSYKGIKNGFYIFNIPLTSDIKYRKKKLYIISIMTLIRYLYHYRLDNIIDYYFQIVDEVGEKIIDKFKAMQVAHFYLTSNYNKPFAANSNHSLADFMYYVPLSKECFFKKVDEEKDYVRAMIHFSWNNKKTYFDLNQSLTKIYNIACNEK